MNRAAFSAKIVLNEKSMDEGSLVAERGDDGNVIFIDAVFFDVPDDGLRFGGIGIPFVREGIVFHGNEFQLIVSLVRFDVELAAIVPFVGIGDDPLPASIMETQKNLRGDIVYRSHQIHDGIVTIIVLFRHFVIQHQLFVYGGI